jgi:hypothetical protein
MGSKVWGAERWWYGRPGDREYLQTREIPDFLAPELVAKTQARVDEILGALRQWDKECDERSRACGLTAAKAASDQAHEQNRELRRKIVETPALTMEGILAKARLMAWCFRDNYDEMSETLTEDLADNGPTAETIAFGLAIDIARLAGENQNHSQNA